jgi:hypothetical protein
VDAILWTGTPVRGAHDADNKLIKRVRFKNFFIPLWTPFFEEMVLIPNEVDDMKYLNTAQDDQRYKILLIPS